jgi:oligopeptidase B
MQAPITPKQITVHEAHQDQRIDHYHWLKERENPEVLAYLKRENAYTEAIMAPVKELQDTLYQETLARIQETDQDAPWPYEGYEYYGRTVQGLEHEIFCRKRLGSDVEEILFDENIHAAASEFFEVGCYELSPDGNWLAITVDQTGDEIFTLWMIDLTTMTLTKDLLTEIAGSVVFSMEPGTLWYCRLDEAQRPYQVWAFDVWGESRAGGEKSPAPSTGLPPLIKGAGGSTLIYEEPDEKYWVGIERTSSDAFLIISCGSKLTTETHYVPAELPWIPPTCFLPREQGHEYAIDHQGDHFYILSNRDAKNYALWRCGLHPAAPYQWELVIPHDIQVTLEGMHCFKDYFVLSKRINGLSQLWVYPNGGKPVQIPVPEVVYNLGLSTNWEYETPTFFYCYHSMTTPPTVFSYDTRTHESTLIKREPVLGDYRPEDYESQRLFATAEDGTKIPISLMFKKSLRTSPMPLYLVGYGAYGIDLDPWFSYSRISLLNRGFVFAIAHIRGGGDLGELWHDAGKLMNKKNTFSDFIACSRYLIDQKWTSPDQFFINGGSAGGLLMGAVLNEAPELYRGAVVQVPFVDMLNTMLDATLPLTVHEYEEWGNPQERAAYDYMKSYSPYDNVRSQAYPALFITSGLYDPRVPYWESAKWTAKLREHQTAPNPILLKVELHAGHGGPSGRYEALKEVAEEFAFVLGIREGKI